MANVDELKLAAAEAAAALVEDGMLVGLGSGTTSVMAIEAIARRVAQGLRITGVASSGQTEELARRLAIPLTTLDDRHAIDLAIDGADEVERGTLNLIKGRGGALLREKLVAASSRRFAIVIDDRKLVDRLCPAREPIPVEVVPFGWKATAHRLAEIGAQWTMRTGDGSEPFVTDGGHYILDCSFPVFDSADALQRRIDSTIGVVDHGLFLGMATDVLAASAGPDGRPTVTRLTRSRGKAPESA